MPQEAEYWSLTQKQFNDYKLRIGILGEKFFNFLKPLGFTDYYTTDDYLGFILGKTRKKAIARVSCSLYRETPLEFEIGVSKWNEENPSGTLINYYNKSYFELSELEKNAEVEMITIEAELKKNSLI